MIETKTQTLSMSHPLQQYGPSKFDIKVTGFSRLFRTSERSLSCLTGFHKSDNLSYRRYALLSLRNSIEQ